MSKSVEVLGRRRIRRSHMSVVITMPPACSRVLPFSRTVIGDHGLRGVEAVDGLRVAGVLHVEVDFEFLGVGILLGRLRRLAPGALFARALLGLALRVFHLLAQLGERRDLVGLLLDVEVVDLLFGQVDDLAGRIRHRRLAIALDGNHRRDAFARALAAEHVDELADRAAKLELDTLIGADVGGQGGRRESNSTQQNKQQTGSHDAWKTSGESNATT